MPAATLCNLHLATEIRRTFNGRALMFCEALVPDGATVCHGCGFPAPTVRLHTAIDNYYRDPHQGGDVEAVVHRVKRGDRRGG